MSRAAKFAAVVVMIRSAQTADAQKICAIYNPYIANATVSFEETPVSVEEMAERIATILKSLPWLVIEEGDVLIGYAYASPWRARSA